MTAVAKPQRRKSLVKGTSRRRVAGARHNTVSKWQRGEDLSSPSETSALFNENILPKERVELLAALSFLEKLEDNWNGHTAKAPSARSVEMAKHFVTCLPLNRSHANKVEPDGDAGVCFTWRSASERVILTIDGAMAYLSHEKDQNSPVFINDVLFFDGADTMLPSEVIERIPSQ